jgi:enterochelin esterase-like enzyme
MTLLNKTPSSIAILFSFLCITISVKAQVVDSDRTQGWEVKTIQSKILGEKRKINVQTPSGMNKYDAYPVLYLLDGEAFTGMVAG